MHDAATAAVATPRFRGPIVGAASVLLAALSLAVTPAAAGRVLGPIRRAGPRVQGAIAVALVIAWALAIGAAFWSWRQGIGELEPAYVLTAAVPLLSVAVALIGGGRLAARLRGGALVSAVVVLLLATASAAWILPLRRATRDAVATLGLQSRRIATILPVRSPPPRPGRSTRLFPAEQAPRASEVARHLVLVTIDALRYDRAFPDPASVTARRRLMPNLAALARRGTSFDAATCTVPGSLRAVPSLLTGNYPNALFWRRPTQVYPDPPRTTTVAEILGRHGFDTLFVPHNRYLLNPGTRQGFARVVDPVLLPEQDRRRRAPRDPAMVAAALEEVGRRRRSGVDRRLFLWSHFWDPHAPYFDHRPGFGSSDEDRYDAEVRSSDRALGELLQGLDRLGVLPDAVVVVTADHGEEFGEHGATHHSRTLFQAAIRIPLVIALPPGRSPMAGRRAGALASHVDVLPTVLPLLGIDPPPGLDGRTLQPLLLGGPPPPDRTILSMAYPMFDRVPAAYAALRGRLKVITDSAGRATALYDRVRDPDERENRVDDVPPEVVSNLEADVATYRARGLAKARR